MARLYLTWDGKYSGLLYGFRYKNGKQHPKYDWVNQLNDSDIEQIIQESLNESNVLENPNDTVNKMGRKLVNRYKTIIRRPKPKTINWYDWDNLANSTEYEIES